MHALILSIAYELDKEDDGYKIWDTKSLRDCPQLLEYYL